MHQQQVCEYIEKKPTLFRPFDAFHNLLLQASYYIFLLVFTHDGRSKLGGFRYIARLPSTEEHHKHSRKK